MLKPNRAMKKKYVIHAYVHYEKKTIIIVEDVKCCSCHKPDDCGE